MGRHNGAISVVVLHPGGQEKLLPMLAGTENYSCTGHPLPNPASPMPEASQLFRAATYCAQPPEEERNMPLAVASWGVGDVQDWLLTNRLGRFAEAFCEKGVNGRRLLELNHEILESELRVLRYGHRCQLLAAVAAARANVGTSVARTTSHAPPKTAAAPKCLHPAAKEVEDEVGSLDSCILSKGGLEADCSEPTPDIASTAATASPPLASDLTACVNAAEDEVGRSFDPSLVSIPHEQLQLLSPMPSVAFAATALTSVLETTLAVEATNYIERQLAADQWRSQPPHSPSMSSSSSSSSSSLASAAAEAPGAAAQTSPSPIICGGSHLPSLLRGSYLGKEVAVRVLRARAKVPSCSVAEKAWRSALKDLSSLRHPGLVLFLGVAERPHACYIVSEYAFAGVSLQAWLEEARSNSSGGCNVLAAACRFVGAFGSGGASGSSSRGLACSRGGRPPSLFDACRVAHGVVAAMSYLHSRGVRHGKLRPWSVLLGESLAVKISDYAVSLLDASLDPCTLSASGISNPLHATSAPFGSGDPWLSPEILRRRATTTGDNSCACGGDARNDVDSGAADVYAFGVILWQLLAAPRQPFEGLTEQQLVIAVGFGKRRLPTGTSILAHAPEALRALVRACLRHDWQRRPTFAELVPILECLEAGDTAKEDALEAFFGKQP